MSVIKGSAFVAVVPARDAAGDLVSVTPTVTISKDGGAFSAATNSPSPLTGYGFSITLTSTEMNAETVIVKSVATDIDIPIMMLSTEVAEKVLATAQPNYAPAKAGDAMALTSGERTTVAASIWNALLTGISTAGSIGLLIKTNLDALISSRSTYAGGDTSGTTTLLGRLTGTRAGYMDQLEHIHDDTTLAYGIVSNGTHGNAALKTLIDAKPTLVQVEASTVLAKKADTDTLLLRLTVGRAALLDNLSNLDAAITSRLSSLGYTAPDNTSITTIKNAVDTEIASILAAVDTEIAAIKTQTDKMVFTTPGLIDSAAQATVNTTTIANAVVAALMDAGVGGATAQQVWEYIDRSLTQTIAADAPTVDEIWGHTARTLTSIPNVTVGGYASGQTPAKPGDTMVPSVVTPATNLSGIATATDVNNARDNIKNHGDLNWVSAAVELTQEQIDALSGALTSAVGSNLADEIMAGITGSFVFTDAMRISQGSGSVSYKDNLTDGRAPFVGAVLRAFKMNGANVDWTEVEARDTTDADGEYEFFLDPGTYKVSVSHKGSQVSTYNITVIEQP
jgi:hypothetical protein